MEFRFNVNDIFKQPIVEINQSLIPPQFSGDRRQLWDAVSKVSEVVNAMGEASAAAQGLTKPITTADRLRNSEHKVYLLIDQQAKNGKGAVTGMLKTGKKGLYVFDRDGHHYQVQPPCVLDFYVHESRQRTGLGKHLFEHMLHEEKVEPTKLAIDRPSEKFLGFLNKHYSLNTPIKQMNNYVVFEGFFPEKEKTPNSENNNSTTPVKNMKTANGLQQNYGSPYGRYGAPRPPCSMGQIIHNQSSTVQQPQEPSGTSLSIRPLPSAPNRQQPLNPPPQVSQSVPQYQSKEVDESYYLREYPPQGPPQSRSANYINKADLPHSIYTTYESSYSHPNVNYNQQNQYYGKNQSGYQNIQNQGGYQSGSAQNSQMMNQYGVNNQQQHMQGMQTSAYQNQYVNQNNSRGSQVRFQEPVQHQSQVMQNDVNRPVSQTNTYQQQISQNSPQLQNAYQQNAYLPQSSSIAPQNSVPKQSVAYQQNVPTEQVSPPQSAHAQQAIPQSPHSQQPSSQNPQMQQTISQSPHSQQPMAQNPQMQQAIPQSTHSQQPSPQNPQMQQAIAQSQHSQQPMAQNPQMQQANPQSLHSQPMAQNPQMQQANPQSLHSQPMAQNPQMQQGTPQSAHLQNAPPQNFSPQNPYQQNIVPPQSSHQPNSQQQNVSQQNLNQQPVSQSNMNRQNVAPQNMQQVSTSNVNKQNVAPQNPQTASPPTANLQNANQQTLTHQQNVPIQQNAQQPYQSTTTSQIFQTNAPQQQNQTPSRPNITQPYQQNVTPQYQNNVPRQNAQPAHNISQQNMPAQYQYNVQSQNPTVPGQYNAQQIPQQQSVSQQNINPVSQPMNSPQAMQTANEQNIRNMVQAARQTGSQIFQYDNANVAPNVQAAAGSNNQYVPQNTQQKVVASQAPTQLQSNPSNNVNPINHQPVYPSQSQTNLSAGQRTPSGTYQYYDGSANRMQTAQRVEPAAQQNYSNVQQVPQMDINTIPNASGDMQPVAKVPESARSGGQTPVVYTQENNIMPTNSVPNAPPNVSSLPQTQMYTGPEIASQ